MNNKINNLIRQYQETGRSEFLNDVFISVEPLIKSLSYKYKIDVDDIYIIFMRCVKHFNSRSGTKFSTYFYNAVQRFFYKTLKKSKEIFIDIKDFLNVSYTKDFEFNLDLKKAILKLPEKEQHILSYYLAGYNQDDIGRTFNTSQSYVSRKLKGIFNKLYKGVKIYE